MGVNTNIYLPVHVKTKRVFEVIQKTMGVEFFKTSFSNNQTIRKNGKLEHISSPSPFNPDLPCSKKNPWYMIANEKTKGEIELTSTSYFNFKFNDISGNYYTCLYHLEIDFKDNIELGSKFLNPSSSILWCAIGKRLIDFFGGKMLYSDEEDEDNLDNWYINDSPIFSYQTKEKSSDDKWYQYYNALNETPLISIKEMNDMLPFASYPIHNREIKLQETLNKIENFKHLENKLEEKPSDIIKKIKI